MYTCCSELENRVNAYQFISDNFLFILNLCLPVMVDESDNSLQCCKYQTTYPKSLNKNKVDCSLNKKLLKLIIKL